MHSQMVSKIVQSLEPTSDVKSVLYDAGILQDISDVRQSVLMGNVQCLINCNQS